MVVDLNLRGDKLYVLWYATIGNTVMLYIVPFTTIVYFNTYVAMEIVRSRATRRRISRSQKADQRTARMLFCVVICKLDVCTAVRYSV